MTHKTEISFWHIAIPVDDLERSVAFYCTNLGFEMVGRDESSTMRQAFVSLGRGGFTIELFVPLGEDAIKPRLRPDHVAFECADIDNYRRKIEASGLLVPEVETFPGGMKHFELRDPDNTKLDFFEGRAGYDSALESKKPDAASKLN
jgi:catechol 2,3-dioxygenase-like lactoylglutathione lyase family enzyme